MGRIFKHLKFTPNQNIRKTELKISVRRVLSGPVNDVLHKRLSSSKNTMKRKMVKKFISDIFDIILKSLFVNLFIKLIKVVVFFNSI